MSRFRWTNPSLPQPLQIAVLLLYISAFFALLGGLIEITSTAGILIFVGGMLALTAARRMVRERKFGYLLALFYAAWDVLGTILSISGGFSAWYLIGLVFAIALIGLLLHPESRQYYRTWFR